MIDASFTKSHTLTGPDASAFHPYIIYIVFCPIYMRAEIRSGRAPYVVGAEQKCPTP